MTPFWPFFLRIGVVVCSCLSAGKFIHTPHAAHNTHTHNQSDQSCSSHTSILDTCRPLDHLVSNEHLVDPFLIDLAALVTMTMPVLVLSHARKLTMVREVGASMLVLFASAGLVHLVSTHVSRAVAYAFGLHTAAIWLLLLQTSEKNIWHSREGEFLYGLFSGCAILCVLTYAFHVGPPIPLLPSHPAGLPDSCGFASHLSGIFFPEVVLSTLFYLSRALTGANQAL